MAVQPSRGEVWVADLDPTRGHEQAGTRPVLVVSANLFNQGPAGLVFVVPLTRTDHRHPFHVPIDPPEGGVKARSFILCDMLRCISTQRLTSHRWGVVTPRSMAKVEEILRTIMGL